MTRAKRPIISILCLLCLCTFLFTGCTREKKTIIDTATLKVTTQGAETTIYDLAGDAEYNYKAVRVKKTDAPTKARTATETDTIKIVLLPGGGFEITDKTAGKIHTLKRGR